MGKIVDIISCYGKALGQVVNFDKIAITFSPNTDLDTRGLICETLNILNPNSHDTYLGLPSTVGRNKFKTYATICDRVWKQVRG